MSFAGAKAISRSRGFSFWFSPKTVDQAKRVTKWHALTESNNKAIQLQAYHKRLTAVHAPGFARLKQHELHVRNYDQHKAAIFCLSIMARKRVAIPLR